MLDFKDCVSNKFTLNLLRREAIKYLLSSPFLSKNAPYERNNATLDVDVIFCFLLKKTKAQLLAHLDEDASKIKEEVIKLIEKRYYGTSIAYIVEEKEFFSLVFYVNHSTLIPKSDTELLVEVSIQAIESLLDKKKSGEWENFNNDGNIEELNILDVFSGSGCVGIATVHSVLSKLEKHVNIKNKNKFTANRRLSIHCSFIDISQEAIEVSRLNATRLLPLATQNKEKVPLTSLIQTTISPSIQTNLLFFCQDATKCFPLCKGKQYDVIMANPPYISHEKTKELLSDGRGEPALALDGGQAGLAFFETLAINAYLTLKNNGFLCCEIGEEQAKSVYEIFSKVGFVNIRCHKDLSQKDRVIIAKKNN